MTASLTVSVGQSPSSTILRPGESFVFTVTLRTNSDYNGPAVDVNLPDGWTIISQSTDPSGTYREQDHQWVWLSGGEKRVTYEVQAPSTAITANETIFCEGSAKKPDNTRVTDTTTSTVAVRETISLDQSWKFDTNARLQRSRPIVANDVLFVGGLSKQVYALSKSDGSQLWNFQREGNLSDSTPALSNDTLYIGGGGGNLFAIDATSGAKKWVVTGDAARVSTPAIRDGTVYIGDNRGRLAAVDAGTGDINWETELGSGIYSKPAISTQRVFVTTNDGHLAALDRATGDVQWDMALTTDTEAMSPHLYEGSVFVLGNRLYALESSSGSPQWSTSVGEVESPALTVRHGSVLICQGRTVQSYNIESGSSEWSTELNSTVRSRPTVTGYLAFVGMRDGRVITLDVTNGTIVDQTATGSRILSPTSTHNGRVFVGRDDGFVYSYGTQ